MAVKSTALDNSLLNAVLRNVAYTSPATVYLALYTVTPTAAGGGTEVTGGSYARQSLTFAAASGGSCATSATVTYPQATAGWGNIVAFGIHDAVSAGNLLYFGALTVTINSGEQLQITSGQLTVSET